MGAERRGVRLLLRASEETRDLGVVAGGVTLGSEPLSPAACVRDRLCRAATAESAVPPAAFVRGCFFGGGATAETPVTAKTEAKAEVKVVLVICLPPRRGSLDPRHGARFQ